MRVTRLYTGPDQLSHAEQVELPERVELPVADMQLHAFEDGELSAHTPSRRLLIIVLNGTIEIEFADGTARVGKGEAMLAEDTTGEGHVSRFSGNVRTASLALTDGTELPRA